MDDPPPIYSYKETHLTLNLLDDPSLITLRLPTHTQDAHGSRPPPRSHRKLQPLEAEDETVFAQRFLATSASVYCRQRNEYPRSVLWRVLEDGKVLSLQHVDLSRIPGGPSEASRTLRLLFPSSIRPAGVTLSDSDQHEFIEVFVLTTTNDLYTLSLSPSLFDPSFALDDGVGRWCQSFLPSSFSFRYPHRLVARSPLELLVSLHDGSLLRLTRKPGDDGSSWVETFFSDGGWGSSLRGLIPWQGNSTVHYGNTNLERSTAIALAFSPVPGEGAPEHLFSISLDHTLRVWNLLTGKIGSSRDLLNEERSPHETAKYLLDPAQTSLITVIDQRLRGSRDRYYVITFSPVGTSQFKFWAVADADQPEGMQDLFPSSVFEPPPPSSEIWTMAQFQVTSAGDPGLLNMWILWKNNMSYRVQSLKFDLLHVAQDWQNPWTATASETRLERPLPVLFNKDSADVTELWMEYLFYPGAFGEATLATALAIYEQNLNVAKGRSTKTKSLKERMCLSVGSSVRLNEGGSGGMDFPHYAMDADAQWRRFYRIVAELEKTGGEALSFALDDYAGLPWIITTGGISAVRECSLPEMLWHNKSSLRHTHETVKELRPDVFAEDQRSGESVGAANLIKAAATFRDCFSDHLSHTCHVVLRSELCREPSVSVPARIQSFYDQCNFLGQISEDDVTQLKAALEEVGGSTKLDLDLFRATINRMLRSKTASASGATATTFGEKTIMRAAQEMIAIDRTILFSLVVLLIFLAVDDSFTLDDVESKGSHSSDSPRRESPRLEPELCEVYLYLLALLRGFDVLKWTTEVTYNNKAVESDESRTRDRMDTGSPERSPIEHRPFSSLQYPCFRSWKAPWPRPYRPMSSLLTESVNDLIGQGEMDQADRYKRHVLQIQLRLLSRGELELASDFARYQVDHAWTRYMEGRRYLLTADYARATIQFRKAAFQLANRDGLDVSFITGDEDLLINEDEAKFFGSGMDAYHYHIIQLFDAERAPSYVAEFAETCLQFPNTITDDESTKKLRADLLQYLFTSSLETRRFSQAYTALSRMADRLRQRQYLTKFVHVMCQEGEGAQLLKFAFLGLQPDVDEILQTASQNVLNMHSRPAYHKILYAWRIQHGDFRGAAAVLHDRLQRLQSTSAATPDPENTAVTQAYLALINTLASVDPSQAWVLSTKRAATGATSGVQGLGTKGQNGTKAPKRSVITMDDIRREYQEELDRIAQIENNQFAFSTDLAAADADADADADVNAYADARAADGESDGVGVADQMNVA
ncbi:MAG: hypothetical protein M1838_003648 [Thelocarpon superellum]|nr:MAG: hypothetical protein M1838_003648 [Thelocarpon superellum]